MVGGDDAWGDDLAGDVFLDLANDRPELVPREFWLASEMDLCLSVWTAAGFKSRTLTRLRRGGVPELELEESSSSSSIRGRFIGGLAWICALIVSFSRTAGGAGFAFGLGAAAAAGGGGGGGSLAAAGVYSPGVRSAAAAAGLDGGRVGETFGVAVAAFLADTHFFSIGGSFGFFALGRGWDDDRTIFSPPLAGFFLSAASSLLLPESALDSSAFWTLILGAGAGGGPFAMLAWTL